MLIWLIQIIDGPLSVDPVLLRNCGNLTTATIVTSSTEAVLVRFSADDTGNGPGFTVNYRATERE